MCSKTNWSLSACATIICSVVLVFSKKGISDFVQVALLLVILAVIKAMGMIVLRLLDIF